MGFKFKATSSLAPLEPGLYHASLTAIEERHGDLGEYLRIDEACQRSAAEANLELSTARRGTPMANPQFVFEAFIRVLGRM
jgi:hypothetical protein